MGEVYAAVDLRLDREVAIKLVPAAGIDQVTRARFVREARAAARINHPNAVAVFDAGEADGFLYLVMERVTGRTLSERLSETGPMPVAEAAAVASAVLAALGAAHSAGVVHRDVKPANIIGGPSGVKLVDFGIATLLGESGSSVTVAGELVGTPKYLAPEQIAGQPATPQTDLYAVGVVLFELVSGVVPFDRGTPVATAIAHREEAAPDVRTIRPDVPPRVAAVIHTALRKRPADRYHSAAEMRRALAPAEAADYAGDTAVLTTMAGVAPDGRRGRGWWWAVAIVVLVVGGAVAFAVADDDPSSAPTTPAVGAPTSIAAVGASIAVAPATTVATTIPTTDASTTTAPPPPPIAPTTPAELIAVLDSDPARFGPQTSEVIQELDEILTRGNPRRRATDLLEDASVWVEMGELSPEAFDLLVVVLTPIADENGDDDDDDD